MSCVCRLQQDYYRRYKVCQAHASDPCVVVRGVQSRFCQQCGTFHEVSEFDLDKRCVFAPVRSDVRRCWTVCFLNDTFLA